MDSIQVLDQFCSIFAMKFESADSIVEIAAEIALSVWNEFE